MWYTLFSYISNAFRWLLGISKKTTKLSPVVYQVIHVVLVLAVTLLLAIFSNKIVLESSVPSSSDFIRRFFCALVFLLTYAFVRLLIYLIALFGVRESGEFEDIDWAWAAGLDALARRGFDLQELPLFLVIGLTETAEVRHFAGAKMKWNVSPGSEERGAALRFYANPEAIFISCPGVGAMSRQLGALAESASLKSPDPPPEAEGESRAPAATLSSQDIQAGQKQTLTAPVPTASHTLLPGQVGQTMSAPLDHGRVRREMSQAPPKLSNDEVVEARRRLEYVCRLLAQERGQFCPINGLEVVLPLDWSKSLRMQSAFESTKHDVETLHSALELSFPLVCVFSGLEEFSGISEFIDRGCKLDARFQDSRAGSYFPVGHRIDDRAGEWLITRGLGWFRGWIYSEFAKDLQSADNTKLYRLLCNLDDRRPRLVRQLMLSFGHLADGTAAWLSGCYFIACGETGRLRAFIGGVLKKLISEQDNVAWSERRLQREHRCGVWASRLFVLAAVLAVTDCVLLWWWLWL